MTNTVRYTARCTFCGRRFRVVAGQPGNPAPTCDDGDGKLCCDDCLCAHCGRGHATEDDAALCEGDSLYPAGGRSDFDYDAWVDATTHTLAER